MKLCSRLLKSNSLVITVLFKLLLTLLLFVSLLTANWTVSPYQLWKDNIIHHFLSGKKSITCCRIKLSVLSSTLPKECPCPKTGQRWKYFNFCKWLQRKGDCIQLKWGILEQGWHLQKKCVFVSLKWGFLNRVDFYTF